MSLKSLLMPVIAARLLSRERLLAKRARAERARRRRGEPHRVLYFHQVDDPYSALAAQALPPLLARYQVELVPHLAGPPPDRAAPERAMLIAHSRRDAALLARRWRLHFTEAGQEPPAVAVERAAALLSQAIARGSFAEEAGAVSRRLWDQPGSLAAVDPAALVAAAARLAAGSALRERLGHYSGATFYYGGEWYWGLDRLHHLERRLQELGAQRAGVEGVLFPPSVDLEPVGPYPNPPPIDFFFSLRSPYSAIVTPRVFALAHRTGAQVRLRFLLPMVMRGLPVPSEKRGYIALDAAREAFVRGIPFGRVNDPLGRPAERGLSLVPFAVRAGKGEAYVESFMRGVWAEGLDAGSDRGLRKIAERAGLEWSGAQVALRDEAWRATAEENRRALFSLGLWGVPSFHVGTTLGARSIKGSA